ncbi:hypothetical protein ACFY00_30820 [Kitasatospora sp. NPDC001540]|uniref:hypothetical protein n=1 Tax=Kitasatospora sp. NPDC001540 TaxID=3364014 RepID=UPI0036C5A7DF
MSFADFCADPGNSSPGTPRPGSAAARGPEPEAAEHTRAPLVLDAETGRVRVMESKCWTCIGRPTTTLSAERRRELLGQQEDGSYDEGWTVCHSTLQEAPYGLPPSVCAWTAQHPQAAERSLAMRVGHCTGFEYVDPAPTFPPAAEQRSPPARTAPAAAPVQPQS